MMTRLQRTSTRLLIAVLAFGAALLAGRTITSAGPEEDLPAPCPVSLSNPDGQHLNLEQYDVRVAMHGPLVLTEMEMIFRNPHDRQMEGKFLYLLPPGATVSRFAKEVDGKLMEGEVVERQRARSVYRQILHTMRDPALLEQDQGNRFSARVFPIPAKGQVRLLLSYSQLLEAKSETRTLRVPLAGMPAIGKFNFKATVQTWPGEHVLTESIADLSQSGRQAGTVQHFTFARENHTPQQDIEMVFQARTQDTAIRTLRAGDYQMTSFRPVIATKAREGVRRDWHLYLDSSASTADTFERRCEALNSLNALIRDRREAIDAYAFDLEVEKIARQENHPDGDDGLPKALGYVLKQRHPLGATDLAAALKHLGETARKARTPSIFVLVSDGIASWGPREAKNLLAALGDWPARHALHALVLGAKQDDRVLKALTEKGLGRIVEVPLNESTGERLREAMGDFTEPLGETFEFYDEGAEWIHPRVFRDVRAGSELVAFSKLKDDAQAKPGAVHRDATGEIVKDHVFEAKPAELLAYAPLLERQAHKAFLAGLEKKVRETENPKEAAALNKQMIEVSVKNRVLCPLTSMLVLETEDDYARFGIDRTALVDIMEVGPQGIRLKKRELTPDEAARIRQSMQAQVRAEEMREGKGGSGKQEKEVAKARKALAAEPSGFDDVTAVSGENQYGPQATHGIEADSLHLLRDMAQGGEAAESMDADHLVGVNPFMAAPSSPTAEQGEGRVRVEERAAPRGDENLRRSSDARALEQGQKPGQAVPPWLRNYNRGPTGPELQELLAKVNAQPRERMPRNFYAEALAKAQKWDELQAACFEWMPFDPENPQIFEFLATSLEKLGDPKKALRAVTSIAEVGPSNHALLARAGWLLLVEEKPELAAGMFEAALKQRDDHPNHYRGLSLSHFMAGHYEQAAKVLEDALAKKFHDRYGDVHRVYREELGYIYRAWLTANDQQAVALDKRTKEHQVDLKRTDAFRVTLCWETDANDVDLHVAEPGGQVCFYSFKKTVNGLELYSDQTQGLGPEVIRTGKTQPGLYHIGVKYFNAGPMGTSRGVVVIQRPVDGVCKKPIVRPFTLVPDGRDIRHLFVEEF